MGTQSPTHKHEIACYISLGAHNTRNTRACYGHKTCVNFNQFFWKQIDRAKGRHAKKKKVP
jgi:hypothetical protein